MPSLKVHVVRKNDAWMFKEAGSDARRSYPTQGEAIERAVEYLRRRLEKRSTRPDRTSADKRACEPRHA